MNLYILGFTLFILLWLLVGSFTITIGHRAYMRGRFPDRELPTTFWTDWITSITTDI